MNDFTKEELMELKRGVDALFEQRDFNEKAETLLLGWKVQSLIDNYCEHEFVATVGRPVPTPGWHEAVIKCAHCGTPK